MALRDKLRERSQPFLPPGEQARHVFLAQGGPSPYLFFLTYLIAFWVKYRIVVVGQQGIYIIKSSVWRPAGAKELLHTVPRQTRIGPVKGLWATTQLGPEKLYVHKRFHKDVEAADFEIGAAA